MGLHPGWGHDTSGDLMSLYYHHPFEWGYLKSLEFTWKNTDLVLSKILGIYVLLPKRWFYLDLSVTFLYFKEKNNIIDFKGEL